MSADVRRWTSLADLRTASLTAWTRGALLREVLVPTGAYPRRRTLRRPSATELRDRYPEARAWAAELSAAADTFALEHVELGRTTIGTNQVPAVAVFPTVEDEIAFVGRNRDAARVVVLAARLTELDPALLAWALARPLQLLDLGEDAVTAARVALWLRANPSPGIHVRQLGLPGVHTKFVEGHRRVIDGMVAVLRGGDAPGPGETDQVADDGAPLIAPGRIPAARFAARHGFLAAPERVRFRVLDPAIPLLGAARDVTVTADAFASLQLPVERVVITENLVNFLSLPDTPGTLAVFGEGYGFSSLQHARWLQGCTVRYWGDLDTHGFRILDQLRALHPHVGSVLMDRETLLAHRERWGTEPSPSRAALTRLTQEEAEAYRALQEDLYGPAVRLEQELIRWDWALERLGRGSHHDPSGPYRSRS